MASGLTLHRADIEAALIGPAEAGGDPVRHPHHPASGPLATAVDFRHSVPSNLVGSAAFSTLLLTQRACFRPPSTFDPVRPNSGVAGLYIKDDRSIWLPAP